MCGAELDVVGSLIDRSLVRRDGDRFEMLSTIREFATELLAERADAAATRDGHASYFEALADRAFADRNRGSAQIAEALALDNDNLREALDWLSRTDPRRFGTPGRPPRLVLARALALRRGPWASRSSARRAR